jgi:RNA polymerase sigma-70 factor (ECF subfamily)
MRYDEINNSLVEHSGRPGRRASASQQKSFPVDERSRHVARRPVSSRKELWMSDDTPPDTRDARPRITESAERLTSIELLRRAQDGHAEALDKLIERYLPPFRRWARHRMPGWARGVMDSDDLVQETLLKTLKNLQSFEPRGVGALQAYLHTAMLNRLRDELRRLQRTARPVSLDSQEPDPRPSPLLVTIGHETYERYLRALGRLRKEDRQAIIARLELGQSWAEVAEVLGKPSADAARVAVSRALRRLAEVMAHSERGAEVRAE